MEFALPERHQHLAARGSGGEDLQPRRLAHQPVSQGHARGKGPGILLVQRPVRTGIVDLVHMVPGRQQVMGQAPLIGQQQQALGILIQPAHRKQALAPELRRQQIQHGLPAAVLRGRQHPGGLVEHQPGKTAVAQPLPVHKDLRGLRVHLVLRRPGGHAVHQDPALPDQLPDLPPGVPAPCGDDLIQPRFLHILPSACDFFCSILS